MIDWIPVTGSARVIAMAYDQDLETIYVRFPNGMEWYYANCPPTTWEEFGADGTSKGAYIANVLNHRPNGRHV